MLPAEYDASWHKVLRACGVSKTVMEIDLLKATKVKSKASSSDSGDNDGPGLYGPHWMHYSEETEELSVDVAATDDARSNCLSISPLIRTHTLVSVASASETISVCLTI